MRYPLAQVLPPISLQPSSSQPVSRFTVVLVSGLTKSFPFPGYSGLFPLVSRNINITFIGPYGFDTIRNRGLEPSWILRIVYVD